MLWDDTVSEDHRVAQVRLSLHWLCHASSGYEGLVGFSDPCPVTFGAAVHVVGLTLNWELEPWILVSALPQMISEVLHSF